MSVRIGEIDKLFVWARDQRPGGSNNLEQGSLVKIAAILYLGEEIPGNLIVLGEDSYTDFRVSLAMLKAARERWQAASSQYPLTNHSLLGDLNPVTVLRRTLSMCPDEPLPESDSTLKFIEDAELREGLLRYLKATEAAISSGRLNEALLLWRLRRIPPIDARNKCAELKQQNKVTECPRDLDKWDLSI